jgi:hypothetical protein
MSIASFRHESQRFPERDTLFSGIERHHPNASECVFEQGKGNLAPYTGPTKSRADVETPHPQRLGDDRVDCNAAYRSQDAFRVRSEQYLTGSIETHRARRPIVREPIEKLVPFGSRLPTHSLEISG